MTIFDNADLVVVGAGFYGMTIAERAAAEGFNVAVIDKRDHIGGNAFRLICALHYNTGKVFLLRFLTHAEYSKDRWKDEL